jgi:hypothetical protein
MAAWHQLRQILALFCIAGILLAAVLPSNPGMLLAALCPACVLAVPITCPAQRVDAGPVRVSLAPYLAAIAGRAPPVQLSETL